MTRQNLNIRASDDGKSYIIEGYMVVFDNVDLYGTRFTKNTDVRSRYGFQTRASDDRAGD
jgi:hypothetical protein